VRVVPGAGRIGVARAHRLGHVGRAAAPVAEPEHFGSAAREAQRALGQHDHRLRVGEPRLRVTREAQALPRRLDRIEQAPEDLALAEQRGLAARLVFRRARLAQHEIEPEGGVGRRLVRARAEVLEPLRAHPWVVLLERGDAHGHDVAREELGQRRCDRRQQVARRHQLDVGVARAPHAGQHVAQRFDSRALEQGGVGQREPEREPALARTRAVVIVDARDPRAPEGRVLRLREDETILDGDARLVVVAVGDPRADLARRQRALVHARIEGMEVVVALGADAAQARLEVVHSASSSPSVATWTPAARTRAASGESGSRTGFVAFMWR
jgi:hypothetical protein